LPLRALTEDPPTPWPVSSFNFAAVQVEAYPHKLFVEATRWKICPSGQRGPAVPSAVGFAEVSWPV
jgi:hypothetical protein